MGKIEDKRIGGNSPRSNLLPAPLYIRSLILLPKGDETSKTNVDKN